jgi:hypothetical protein
MGPGVERDLGDCNIELQLKPHAKSPTTTWLDLCMMHKLNSTRAAELYREGHTMQEIAKELGVAKSTICEDLRNCSPIEQLKPARSPRNPRGAGRPE